ncbi:hypothetical protein ALT721_560037 [Alteromonas alvinellae]
MNVWLTTVKSAYLPTMNRRWGTTYAATNVLTDFALSLTSVQLSAFNIFPIKMFLENEVQGLGVSQSSTIHFK